MFEPVRIPPKITVKPTKRDRSALDFSRFHSDYFNGCEPQRGVSYERLLAIATEVCGYEIRDLSQVWSKKAMERIKMRLKEEKKDEERRNHTENTNRNKS